jgi:hypothetical protein
MLLWTLLEGLIPLIIFVLIRHFKKNTKLAVYCAGTVGIGLFLLSFAILGKPDYLFLGELAFILIFGWLSAYKDDPVWFKLQPIAIATVVILGVGYLHFYGGGLVNLFLDQIMLFLPDNFKVMFENEDFLAYAEITLSYSTMVSVFLHASLVTFAAYHWSDSVWLALRAFGIYPIGLLVNVIIIQIYSVTVGMPVMPG